MNFHIAKYLCGGIKLFGILPVINKNGYVSLGVVEKSIVQILLSFEGVGI